MTRQSRHVYSIPSDGASPAVLGVALSRPAFPEGTPAGLARARIWEALGPVVCMPRDFGLTLLFGCNDPNTDDPSSLPPTPPSDLETPTT